MRDNFNPVQDTREVPYWKGHQQRRVFFPAAGSAAFVVFIETTGREPAVRQALAELAKLADNSEQLEWHPAAEPGCDPSIVLHVTALTHAHKPPEK